jgi:hypothetical protein
MKHGKLFINTVIPTISLPYFGLLFKNIFKAIFPIKYKSIGKVSNDWTTQGIKTSCKRKRSLYIYSMNSNTQIQGYFTLSIVQS